MDLWGGFKSLNLIIISVLNTELNSDKTYLVDNV